MIGLNDDNILDEDGLESFEDFIKYYNVDEDVDEDGNPQELDFD